MEEQTQGDAARAAMLSGVLAPAGTLDLRRLRAFVPTEWTSRACVGLDGVLRITHPAVDEESAPPTRQPRELPGLPVPLREQLAALTPAFQGQQLSGEDAVAAVEAAHRLTARVAEARLHATRELTARTAEETLRLTKVTCPDELSPTARQRWRARAKSLTAAEVRTLTGLGAGTAREVVSIANAPEPAQGPVRQGLRAGIAGWDLVRAWWRRCTDLPHEAGAQIARALFGTDVPLEEVAHERLTPEGELSDAPWPKKAFYDALERLAQVHEGTDPAGQANKREARHAARDAYAIVDDDGTAQLVITGDAASVTACLERLQTIAVKARAEGDPRTVAALRSDTARALLLHGTLRLPDLDKDAHLLTPDDITRLVDVISGTPTHELQVIVPWDALTGQPALVNPYPPRSATDQPHPGPTGDDDGDGDPQVLAGVGRTLGRFSRFLSRAEIARIAGRPGTTLHRLLTDPADGRCLERSRTRYAPDAAMRAQLRAADVTSRAPGSTVPAARCDLDHVQEYLLGGPTAETNLQSVDRTWHALKTEKFWDAVMDETRNVTWESFWGRLYPTRPHDYRQYLARPAGALHPHQGRHLASLFVYAALAHRQPGDRLAALDDDPDSDGAFLGLREAMWIRHTTAGGRPRTGPAPGTPTPERITAHDPRTVLHHPRWTTLGQSCDDGGQGEPGSGDRGDTPAPPPPF